MNEAQPSVTYEEEGAATGVRRQLHRKEPIKGVEYVDLHRAGPDDRFIVEEWRSFYWDLDVITAEIERLEGQGKLPNRMHNGEKWFLSFEIELLAWRRLYRDTLRDLIEESENREAELMSWRVDE